MSGESIAELFVEIDVSDDDCSALRPIDTQLDFEISGGNGAVGNVTAHEKTLHLAVHRSYAQQFNAAAVNVRFDRASLRHHISRPNRDQRAGVRHVRGVDRNVVAHLTGKYARDLMLAVARIEWPGWTSQSVPVAVARGTVNAKANLGAEVYRRRIQDEIHSAAGLNRNWESLYLPYARGIKDDRRLRQFFRIVDGIGD